MYLYVTFLYHAIFLNSFNPLRRNWKPGTGEQHTREHDKVQKLTKNGKQCTSFSMRKKQSLLSSHQIWDENFQLCWHHLCLFSPHPFPLDVSPPSPPSRDRGELTRNACTQHARPSLPELSSNMAAAMQKFPWLETLKKARKTNLVQDGKLWSFSSLCWCFISTLWISKHFKLCVYCSILSLSLPFYTVEKVDFEA